MSTRTGTLGSMTNLFTQAQVTRLARRHGASRRQARILGAIAMVEGANPSYPGKSDFDLVGDLNLVDNTWGPSYSGWQIRSLWAHKGTGDIRDGDRLGRPRFAVHSALAILEVQGFSAWSTYQDGSYKAYLQDEFPPPPDTHIVVSGDTLSEIAERYDTTVDDLAALNGLVPPYRLSIGQHITIR